MSSKVKKPAVVKNDFFKKYDHELKEVSGHFSRAYEYSWVLNFIRRKDIVADLGCGSSPLPLLLSKKCKRVYAVDLKDGVYELDKTDNVEPICSDVTRRIGRLGNNSVDRAVAVDLIGSQIVNDDRSTLHALNDLLKETARILKRDGLMLVTVHLREFESGSITLSMFRCLVDESPMKFVDSIHADSVDAIYDQDRGGRVYHAVLGVK